jgi:hypothetical protein
MSAELEAAVLDGVATVRRPRHGPTRPPGSPCANCGAILQGAWCHDCGQLAEDFHRSIWRLMMEAVEGITHLDGRFWVTAPALVLRPGKLTLDYIDGHRAAQIPPLRLFLVVLLLVFFIGSVTGGKADLFKMNGAESPAARARAEAQIDKMDVQIGAQKSDAASRWVRPRLKAVLEDPERFKLVLESQAERFAFLSLPVATLLLTLLFVFQRRFYIFDHSIFALHSLSFQGLLFCVAALAGKLWDPLSSLLWLAAPVHLFVHMRGAYRTSVAGTLLRMTLLAIGSLIGFVILALLLVLVGLSAMG